MVLGLRLWAPNSGGSGLIPDQGTRSHTPQLRPEKWKSLSCVWLLCLTLCDSMDSPWNSPGQSTGVGSFSLLQGLFPTQGSNPGLPHCRQILYQLSHKGSPRILEWVAYSFSRGSSQPRNRTGVFCNAGRFFTNWATREAQDDACPHLIALAPFSKINRPKT